MNEPEVHYIFADLKLLDESSQRELHAYRKLGSVKEFRRLQHEEIRRHETRERLHHIVNTLLAGAVFGASIVGLVFLMILLS